MGVNELERLIANGQLSVGDELYHPPRRHGLGELTVRVVANGVEIGDKRYRSLSTAAKDATGYATNGWTFWRHRRTGRVLAELRNTS